MNIITGRWHYNEATMQISMIYGAFVYTDTESNGARAVSIPCFVIDIYIQLISLNWNLVNRNFRKWVGCEALAPIQDNGSLL